MNTHKKQYINESTLHTLYTIDILKVNYRSNVTCLQNITFTVHV